MHILWTKTNDYDNEITIKKKDFYDSIVWQIVTRTSKMRQIKKNYQFLKQHLKIIVYNSEFNPKGSHNT